MRHAHGLKQIIVDNPDWWEKEPSGRWKTRRCQEFSRLGGPANLCIEVCREEYLDKSSATLFLSIHKTNWNIKTI